jgi:hypothetical protein
VCRRELMKIGVRDRDTGSASLWTAGKNLVVATC